MVVRWWKCGGVVVWRGGGGGGVVVVPHLAGGCAGGGGVLAGAGVPPGGLADDRGPGGQVRRPGAKGIGSGNRRPCPYLREGRGEACTTSCSATTCSTGTPRVVDTRRSRSPAQAVTQGRGGRTHLSGTSWPPPWRGSWWGSPAWGAGAGTETTRQRQETRQ